MVTLVPARAGDERCSPRLCACSYHFIILFVGWSGEVPWRPQRRGTLIVTDTSPNLAVPARAAWNASFAFLNASPRSPRRDVPLKAKAVNFLFGWFGGVPWTACGCDVPVKDEADFDVFIVR